jgi:hypothetical protein
MNMLKFFTGVNFLVKVHFYFTNLLSNCPVLVIYLIKSLYFVNNFFN